MKKESYSMKGCYLNCALILSVMIVLNIYALYGTYYQNMVLSNEGGSIETVTALGYLLAGVMLFFQGMHRVRFERRATVFFAVTCVVFFLKEVDIEDYDVPYLVEFFGSGAGRNILFTIIYLLMMANAFWKDRGDLWHKTKCSFKSPVSITVLIGCVFIVVGSIFEKLHMVLGEELMEMNGALLILMASLMHRKVPIYIEQCGAPRSSSQSLQDKM